MLRRGLWRSVLLVWFAGQVAFAGEADPPKMIPPAAIVRDTGTTIVVPEAVKPYRIITLTATGIDTAKQSVWWTVKRVDRDAKKVVDYAGPGKTARNQLTCQWTGSPGDYDVRLTVGSLTEGGLPTVEDYETSLTIPEPTNVAPPPKPKPDPIDPVKPDPKPPTPDPADPALTKTFADAIAADLKVMGTAATKDHVAKLSGVYTEAAKLLRFTDPAPRPKTWGDLVEGMASASRLAGVPVLPDLMALRTAVAAEVGSYTIATALDDELREKIAAKYDRVAAALTAAAK